MAAVVVEAGEQQSAASARVTRNPQPADESLVAAVARLRCLYPPGLTLPDPPLEIAGVDEEQFVLQIPAREQASAGTVTAGDHQLVVAHIVRYDEVRRSACPAAG
ncbi:hypothetical protein AB0I22_38900 [Streptomyces sp. NPDC050610]|uniref:hypothetical protein n=1 Tax=Streptomyces sp. NPDC050610 TaxID=3157097 RepID=UPI003416BBC1